MKIGLTGGTGFIGQHLLKEFADEHIFIIPTSKKQTDEFFQHEKIKYVYSDYTYKSFSEVFGGCECIVHLAAKRFTPDNEKSFANYIDNITMSENVFEAAHTNRIKNIVNISTISVYNPAQKQPYNEGITEPLNRYGISKLCVEKIAGLYNQKKEMKIKSLRLAQVIGTGERGGYLLSAYLEGCLKKQTLAVFGKGKSAKEYIYIKDVTAAIINACEKHELRGSFNIGSGVSTSNLELAEAFCEVFNNAAGYELLPDKKEDNLTFLMDVSLAREKLGFSARYHLKAALEDMKKELGVQA